MSVDIVIPTLGRPTLGWLLGRLTSARDGLVGRILVVDDRPPGGRPLSVPPGVEVVRGPGRGPAAARNAGWRESNAEWIGFLDDDVLPEPQWPSALARDLAGLPEKTAAVQGRIVVPLPTGRRPTDWDRNVKGLEGAPFITADMAYRRLALLRLGGFDERFSRPYREDVDLALRALAAGYELVRGRRCCEHPPGPVGRLASVRAQRGNADDALMRALHGPEWRSRAGAGRGRFPVHALVAGGGAAAVAALLLRRRRAAIAAGAAWLAGTVELAYARIAPGPRSPDEVLTMIGTSVLLPPAALYHRLRGELRARRLVRSQPPAVLLDRDGTLIENVPYNGDPKRVLPRPGAREALDRLRAAGIRLAVVTNQSGVGRGLVTPAQVEAVNRRTEQLLGPLGPWLVCPHAPEAGCACRKPSPELVRRAAAALGVEPSRCVLVGDVGSDVEAAEAAGARAILVPDGATLPAEIEAARLVAPDLPAAAQLILEGKA